MDRVQWLNDSGGYEIGRIFRESGCVISDEYGTQRDSELIPEERILIIPYHGGDPVFVEYGKLSPRPSHEVLEVAK